MRGFLSSSWRGSWSQRERGAQDEPAKAEAASPKASPTTAVSLGQFVPKENLILYVEFAGLNATETAWKNTAAYRMLSDTPLGVMMEQVSTQLLEKALTLYPNHRLSGAEMVSLIKQSAQKGWVLAIHADPKGAEGSLRGTLVVRKGAGKELKVLSAHTIGWMMGDVKPKVDHKSGRTLAVVPAAAAGAPAAGPAGGWVWWAEKDDLAISFPGSASRRACHRRPRWKNGNRLGPSVGRGPLEA